MSETESASDDAGEPAGAGEPAAPAPGPAEPPAPAVAAPPPADEAPAPATPTLPARHRIVYSNATFIRVNPLGAENRLQIIYQRRLWGRAGKLFDGTYVGLGPKIDVSPSNARLGGLFELVPLAILQLRAGYYLLPYFGSQSFKAHPFTSPNDEFGPDQLEQRADAGQAISTYGGQLELSALFQIKAGPIALRDGLSVFHNSFNDLPAPSDVFYDLRTDQLVPGKGWFLGNDADLLYVNDKIRLAAGVRATYFHVFYPDAVFEPGDEQIKGQNDHLRVGPLVTYRLKDRPHRRFMRPTIFFGAQWWVKHRYRAGQQVNQGIPLIVAGFSFTGDLWARD